ncbi:MAG: MmcQ/YjbR family DNA-binding protein, partial [Verrucomicrobiota bacterium]
MPESDALSLDLPFLKEAPMNHPEKMHSLALSLPETTEGTPFGPDVAVYKVAGKMFAPLAPDEFPVRMNLKCEPERALQLRDEHEAVLPG